MKLPQIQIRTTDIQMNWQKQAPVQHIQQPQAKLTISQPAATLEMHTTPGKLTIDSSDARRDLGYFPTGEMIKRYAQEGKQEAMRGLARRAQEGRQMMESAGKGQKDAVIQQIAKQNHGPKREGPYNIKFVPSVGSVKTNYQPSKLDINITRNKPQINVQVNKAIHDYTPGKIMGTMVQRPRVDIDVLS
ncbi:DUF6470 family protein [Lysinibacillus sp. FSL H8-0500]|uniref:YviE n=1 Tax=Lysinibacillus macroides TaxID=33935 RepID=A0A0M9DKN3_9BACI|nr:DUF6470 family protein [Lysinibacillus macroides]KOY82360.1 hypothetical protein ADM90_03170 [Lysinibacillus macroides]QPR66600.1 hypothetical protein I6G82_15075 [Lysinibacillus macroides]